MVDNFAQRYFSGKHLYGDDFDEESIKQWFAEEEHGYYNLGAESTEVNNGKNIYGYDALNHFHAYRHLRGLTFPTALAVGCARGDDIAPLSRQIGRIIAVEPERRWWRDRIGSAPATFHAPCISGAMPADTGTVDLAVCLGALHHIPNVTAVLQEISRAMSPGAIFILREPVTTMGDWRRARQGLTKNERGIPLPWLEDTLDACGLRPLRRGFCMFPLTSRIARVAKLQHFYNSDAIVLTDYLTSKMSAWNYQYHRTSIWRKIAPSSVFYVLAKR